MCVCLCLSRRANLRTGASRRLTEGTNGLSGTFHKNKKAFSLKLLRYKVRSVINLPGTKPARVFTLQCFVYSPFHVRTASAIMVLRKRMRVRGYSRSMCTAPATCTTHVILNTPMLCSTSDPRLSRSCLIPCVKRKKIHILQHARH